MVYRDDTAGIPGVNMESHVTLLFGLMKPGPEQMDVVDEALKDWTPPKYFTPSRISVFVSDNPWDVVVLEPMYPELFLKAHQALSRLPHVNTFPDYKPHLTLSYIRKGYGYHVRDALQRPLWDLHPLKYAGLDYGH